MQRPWGREKDEDEVVKGMMGGERVAMELGPNQWTRGPCEGSKLSSEVTGSQRIALSSRKT